MNSKLRVNYDSVAHLYDSQPYREKTVDPELIEFLKTKESGFTPSILDLGCGTGSQLIANLQIVQNGQLYGVDRFLEMLKKARSKTRAIPLVQATATRLPFRSECFDFISNQFVHHHIPDKPALFGEVFRLLRHGGRFVTTNVNPHEMQGWLYYEYFPEAWSLDLKDFSKPSQMKHFMEETGFSSVQLEIRHNRFSQDLNEWLGTVLRRDTCSQLIAISDEAYEKGLEKLKNEVRNARGTPLRENHVCIATIRGDK